MANFAVEQRVADGDKEEKKEENGDFADLYRPRKRARRRGTATSTPATVREEGKQSTSVTVASIPPRSYIFCFLQITPKFA